MVTATQQNALTNEVERDLLAYMMASAAFKDVPLGAVTALITENTACILDAFTNSGCEKTYNEQNMRILELEAINDGKQQHIQRLETQVQDLLGQLTALRDAQPPKGVTHAGHKCPPNLFDDIVYVPAEDTLKYVSPSQNTEFITLESVENAWNSDGGKDGRGNVCSG